ncbi:MAG: site-specific integrase [bacterium]
MSSTASSPAAALLAPAGAGDASTETGLALAPAEARRIRELLAETFAPATRRAYASDLKYFFAWTDAAAPEYPAGTFPVPVPTLLRFVLHHVDGLPEDVARALEAAGVRSPAAPLRHAPPTVARRLAALGTVHRLLDLEDNPARAAPVRELLRAARRRAVREGYRPATKRAAASPILEAMLRTCDEDLAGLRDRALLLFGFGSGGRRRSEIAAAAAEDLEPTEGGYLFRMRVSKTEPEGDGAALPVLGRAALALDAWREAAGVDTGPLFRAVDRWGNVGGRLSPEAVGAIVKRRAAAAGWPPEAFGGHSLRSGFITEAGRRGIPLPDAMALSRHRSLRVAAGYHQAGSVTRNPAAHLVD